MQVLAERVGYYVDSRSRRLRPGRIGAEQIRVLFDAVARDRTGAAEIREAYVECVTLLIARRAQLSLATHDEIIAARMLALVQAAGYAKGEYELQVLLGVRSELWTLWKNQGQTVPVYVRYGPEWKPYSLRGMRKNPRIFWHVVRASLGMSPAR